MIGVNDQFIVKFSIGNLVDFISEDELVRFTYVEEAGNQLPTFELIFKIQDEEIASLLNENNQLVVAVGRTVDDMVESKFNIMSPEITPAGSVKRNTYINGLYGELGYLGDAKVQITEEKSGVEVIKDIVSPYFSTEFNVLKSLDKQRWIQYGRTNKLFVNDIYMHSDFGSSFPSIGISSDGTFILKDVKKSLGASFDWRFTQNPTLPTDINLDPNVALEDNTSFINSWLGYGRNKTVYNLEKGTESKIKETPETILSLARDIPKNSAINNKYSPHDSINGNVHANYWKSYMHNLVSLASLSAVKVSLSFSNVFYPIRVLDLAMLNDPTIDENIKYGSSEYNSGLYIITKVARTIENRQISTVVEMVRESLNTSREA